MKLEIAILAGDGIGPKVTNEAVSIRKTVAKRMWMAAFISAAVLGLVITADAQPATAASLAGSWDCKKVAMNDHGKPGSGMELKPRSMVFTFTADGKWSMDANDATKTKKSGTYEVRGAQLLLKNFDGTTYQNWKTEFSDDGRSLTAQDKKLFETFEKTPAETQ